MSLSLEPLIRRKLLDIKHIFIPVRNLDTIAKSRMDTELYWPGSPETFEAQRDYSALALGFSIDLCITHHLPYTIMIFPGFVENPIYCYEMLSKVIETPYTDFIEVFEQTTDLRIIKFGGNQ